MAKIGAALKKDTTWLGLILGILVPWLGLYLYYLIQFLPHGESFSSFINLITANQYLIPAVMSLCLILNAVLFFVLLRFRRDLTARGLLVATILYGCVIVVLKIT
ncbi:MAG TPA: hypothetical protein VNE41_07220 [Chitinophagaceae bacterium]|nr:hypothetical protein [Chitinophagaceae bacterium]